MKHVISDAAEFFASVGVRVYSAEEMEHNLALARLILTDGCHRMDPRDGAPAQPFIRSMATIEELQRRIDAALALCGEPREYYASVYDFAGDIYDILTGKEQEHE